LDISHIADCDGQRAAGTAFADHGTDDGDLEAGELEQVSHVMIPLPAQLGSPCCRHGSRTRVSIRTSMPRRREPMPRLMAVNIDEGEPGTFKDRVCLESDPHRVLEGMLIAGLMGGQQVDDLEQPHEPLLRCRHPVCAKQQHDHHQLGDHRAGGDGR